MSGMTYPLVEMTKCPSAAAQTSAKQVYCASTSLLFSTTMQIATGRRYPRASEKIHISV